MCEDWEAADDFKPEETDVKFDFERSQFLDLSRPLFMQIWEANFSKSYYLQQVHQPRHVPVSPRLFGNWYLEVGLFNPLPLFIHIHLSLDFHAYSVVRRTYGMAAGCGIRFCPVVGTIHSGKLLASFCSLRFLRADLCSLVSRSQRNGLDVHIDVVLLRLCHLDSHGVPLPPLSLPRRQSPTR